MFDILNIKIWHTTQLEVDKISKAILGEAKQSSSKSAKKARDSVLAMKIHQAFKMRRYSKCAGTAKCAGTTRRKPSKQRGFTQMKARRVHNDASYAELQAALQNLNFLVSGSLY
jgi:hypothetical protein